MKQEFNVEDLARQIATAPKVCSDDYLILGGMINEGDVKDFLRSWYLSDKKMEWSLWEWTNSIILEKYKTSCDNIALLERVRIFGEDGDLYLRRTENCFQWSFIGIPGINPPPRYLARRLNPDVCMRLSEEKEALLWGAKKKGAFRIEKRVGFRVLAYPEEFKDSLLVVIKYREYLDAGRSAFVRWYGLEEGNDKKRQD